MKTSRKIELLELLKVYPTYSSEEIPNNTFPWRAFGFYDYVNITPINGYNNNETMLANIQAKLQSTENIYVENCYKKKIILLSSTDQNQFWEKEYPILLVVLINFSSIYLEKSENPLADLINKLANKTEDSLKNTNIQAAVYNSLGCFDAVIIMKGDNYTQMLATVAQMTNWDCAVQYTFSVPCIAEKYFGQSDNIILPDKTGKEKVSITLFRCEDEYDTSSDPSQFEAALATHFYNNQIKKISNRCFTIPGNEDMYVALGKVSLQEIVGFFKIYHDFGPGSGVVTQIAISRQKPSASASLRRYEQTNIWCKKLSKFTEGDFKKPWVYTFQRLLNEMKHLESTCYGQDLFWQMKSGIDCFLDLLARFVKNGGLKEFYDRFPTEVEHHINKFLRGWSTLVQQSTNADAQLIQFPSHSTLPVEYPAKLVASYTAFCRKIGLAYVSWDIDEPTQIASEYFLVPKLCTKPSFSFLLKLEDKIKKQGYIDTSPKKTFAYVDVPYQQLFNPKLMFVTIAHEVAHIAGHNCRERDTRTHHLLYSAIFEFINITYIKDKEYVKEEFEASSSDVLVEAYKLIFEKTLGSWDSDNHLKPLIMALKSGFFSTLLNQENQAEIVEAYCKNSSICAHLETERNEETQIEMRVNKARELFTFRTRYLNNVQKFITENTLVDVFEKLEALYSEVYADVAMICLLDLSFKEYIKALCETENINCDDACFSIRLENTILKSRIVAVIDAFVNDCELKEKWNFKHLNLNPIEKWFVEVYKNNIIIRSGEKIDSAPNTVMLLRDYSAKCRTTIETKSKNDETKEIREIYQRFCGIDYESPSNTQQSCIEAMFLDSMGRLLISMKG